MADPGPGNRSEQAENSKLGSDTIGSNARPIGSNGGDKGYINPATARTAQRSGTAGTIRPEQTQATGPDTGEATEGTGKRGRGRPPGAKSKATGTTEKAEKLSVGLKRLETVLIAVHFSLAEISKIPEFNLSPDEAKNIADATRDVLALYNFKTDPKSEAWFNLMMVLGSTYGTRGIAFYMRVNSEKKLTASPRSTTTEKPAPRNNGFDPTNIELPPEK